MRAVSNSSGGEVEGKVLSSWGAGSKDGRGRGCPVWRPSAGSSGGEVEGSKVARTGGSVRPGVRTGVEIIAMKGKKTTMMMLLRVMIWIVLLDFCFTRCSSCVRLYTAPLSILALARYLPIFHRKE